MKVAVVTCTGDRPELFALCRRWVERQSVPIDKWLVSTDAGDSPDIPEWAEMTRFSPTRMRNHLKAFEHLISAVSKIGNDHYIVVMEDDDWYSADHVKTMVEAVSSSSGVAMLSRVPRFNLPIGIFSGTRVDESLTKLVPGVAAFSPGMARAALTKMFMGNLIQVRLVDAMTCVSIKGAGFGLPGRRGATRPHDPAHVHNAAMEKDVDDALFKSLTGDDAVHYLRMVGRA